MPRYPAESQAGSRAPASNLMEKGLGHPKCSCVGKGSSKAVPGSPIPERREALPVPVLLLELDHQHQGTFPCFRSHFSEFPRLSWGGKASQSLCKFRKRMKIKSAISASREEGTDLSTGSSLEFTGIGSGPGTKPRRAENSALSVSPTC